MGDVLKINRNASLVLGMEYALSSQGVAVLDSSNNSFTGLQNVLYNFKVECSTPAWRERQCCVDPKVMHQQYCSPLFGICVDIKNPYYFASLPQRAIVRFVLSLTPTTTPPGCAGSTPTSLRPTGVVPGAATDLGRMCWCGSVAA